MIIEATIQVDAGVDFADACHVLEDALPAGLTFLGATEHPDEDPEPRPLTPSRAAALRAWQLRLTEHLGMDPEQVVRIHDTPHSYVPQIPGGPTFIQCGRRVAWEALEEQTPRIGYASPPSYYSSGDVDDPPRVRATVVLRPEEWAETLDAIGPKPELLTSDEELALRRLRDGRR
jgi:hypothetical protein